MADPSRVTLPEIRVVSEPPKSYALSGKIMLSAVVVLFAVVVFMAGLQLYAKWYVFRLRRRRLQRRASRSLAVECVDGRGLDPAVLNSLVVFVHAPPSLPMECAVCISEFVEGESGRVLPNCGHAFHTECIDMWFGSHSTCPLCRTPVEKPEVEEPGSSSGSGDPDRKKDSEMSVEVPARSRSTVKRMLSMGRRSTASLPESTGDLDLESGSDESDRVRTPS